MTNVFMGINFVEIRILMMLAYSLPCIEQVVVEVSMIIQQGRKGSGTSVTEFGLTSVRTISWRGRGVGE